MIRDHDGDPIEARDVLDERELAEYAAAQDGHQHQHAYDSAAGPDHTGRLAVTERCHCGAALRTYADSIL